MTRSSIERSVGSPSSNHACRGSVGVGTDWSSASSESSQAASSRRRVSQRLCSSMRSVRSMALLLSVPAGTRRPPGGWKWTPFGAASRKSPSNRLGETPKARANARENASDAEYPAPIAASMTDDLWAVSSYAARLTVLAEFALFALELGERALVLRLVQADLAGSRNPQMRDQSESLVSDLAVKLSALLRELGHGPLDVLAHKEQLVGSAWERLAGRMDADLRRRQREDEPAVVRVHVLPPEHVAEERARGLRILGVDERVRPADHAANLSNRISSNSRSGLEGPCRGTTIRVPSALFSRSSIGPSLSSRRPL